MRILSRKEIAKHMSRQERGSKYVGMFFTLLTVAGMAKLLGLDYSIFIIFPVTCILYYTFTYLLGFVDEVKGIWKEQNNYNFVVTPQTQEMYDMIQALHTDMENRKATFK
jgi:hypothetical protein